MTNHLLENLPLPPRGYKHCTKSQKLDLNKIDIYRKKLRRYQADAIKATENKEKGQIILPTGTGKTLIQAHILLDCLIENENKNKKATIAVLAHRLGLCDQILDNILEPIVNCGFDVNILKIGSEGYDTGSFYKKYNLSKDSCSILSSTNESEIKNFVNETIAVGRHLIVVSTYHSCSNLVHLGHINVATCDEAHTMVCNEFANEFEICRNIINRCFYFTATPRVFGGFGGMNDSEIFGDCLYEMSPKEALDLGLIVNPKIHFISPNINGDGDYNNTAMLVKTIVDGFEKHRKLVKKESHTPEDIGGKLLVAVSGTDELNMLVQHKDFIDLYKHNNIDVFWCSSADGCYHNGQKCNSKNDFMSRMNKVSDDKNCIILNIDMLSEGIDLPAITGVLIFRTMTKIKLIQVLGRALRLNKVDRENLSNGKLNKDNKNKYIKPYAYLLLPDYLDLNTDYMKSLISEVMNMYGISKEEIVFEEQYNSTTKIVREPITPKDEVTHMDNICSLKHTIETIIRNDRDTNFSNKLLECKTLDQKSAVIRSFCSQYKSDRRRLVDLINNHTVDDDIWQNGLVPLVLCDKVANLLPANLSDCRFLVLFNLELLEILYQHNVSSNSIIFIANNSVELECAISLYGISQTYVSANNTINLIQDIVKITMPNASNFVVLMNPPYQRMDGGGGNTPSSSPIYQEFITEIWSKLKPRQLISINPNRWMSGGKGLVDFRTWMISNKHLKTIIHYPESEKVFEDVSIAGGVQIINLDQQHNSPHMDFVHSNNTYKIVKAKFDIIPNDMESVSIIDKILQNPNFVNETTLPQKQFGIRSNYNIWSDVQTKHMCYSKHYQKHFISRDNFTDNHNVLNKWKVCMPKATSEGNRTPNSIGQIMVFSNLFIVEPDNITTETYLVINAFDTKHEADCFLVYAKTKFFRYLTSLRLSSQNISRSCFSWVPQLNDYNKPWSDLELANYFKLTTKEMAHIDSKIKVWPK
jgi:superfamily II DNA or RNA helicase